MFREITFVFLSLPVARCESLSANIASLSAHFRTCSCLILRKITLNEEGNMERRDAKTLACFESKNGCKTSFKKK